MIGNETDAALALSDFETGMFEYLFSDNGSTRSVHLINGVLYKIDRSDCHYSVNEYEYSRAEDMRNDLPDNVAIPNMSLYEINCVCVLAVEMVTGILTGECYEAYDVECGYHDVCLSYDECKILEAIGFYDNCYGNAIKVDDTLYLVDVA